MLRLVARPIAVTATWAAAAAVVLAVVASAAPAAPRAHARVTSAVTCPGADVAPSVLGLDRTRQALLCLVNWERSGAGKAPLVLDDRLSAAAQAHSDDMVARNYFSHDAPPPAASTFDARILAAGYALATDGTTAGENIAVGQATARTLVAAWLGSTGPCQSVLSSSFTAVGFGMSLGGTQGFGGPTWTQTLARGAGQPDPGGATPSCPAAPAKPAPTDPLARYFTFFRPWQSHSTGPGGVGAPAVVVAPSPPPAVVAPPATPPEQQVEITKVRRSKRTLRLHLTLPVATKSAKKKSKSTKAKKSKKRTEKQAAHHSKKAKKHATSTRSKKAKQRGMTLTLISSSAKSSTSSKKKHTKKATSSKKKTSAKKQASGQVTVRLRVIQKGQKARSFTFRRAGGRTYRLRIRLRSAKRGTVRVQAAGQKTHARFK